MLPFPTICAIRSIPRRDRPAHRGVIRLVVTQHKFDADKATVAANQAAVDGDKSATA
ncbi:MAG TPA: hypothetical protein VGR45_14705 [Stellaceae bacterium]|nr:hypothetical protein [Stellaceae bacterium]